MKAPDFAYRRPETVAEAIALLADGADALPLAGGQSLMAMMNLRMARPDMLIDLNRIAGLSYVRHEEDEVAIGAMTRMATLLAADAEVTRALPLLAMALPHVAHAAVRNRGTIGGSVALADPAAELPAVLLAQNAAIVLEGPAGRRTLPADDFFLGIYETARAADELIVEIRMPTAGGPFGFHELARRHGDYAMTGVAVALGLPRIAFFGVADRAVRATGAETALAAGRPVEEVVAAIDLEFAGDLHTSAETKRHYAGVVLKRALQGAR